MQYQLRCVNLELSDLERDALDKKLNRLEKLIVPPFHCDITLEHDSHHLKGAVITCRANISAGKHVFHAERTLGTVPDAIDAVIEALEQELKRHRDKQIEQSRTVT